MRNHLKATQILTLLIACLMSLAGQAGAQQEIVDQALEVCQPEIESFCSQVTPGEGRLLACFVAHEDKLSGQCSWALYQAMDELEAFMDAIGYVAEACWDDVEEHCAEVEMGEGRVGVCLLDNQDKVTAACREAMEEVELEKVED